MGNDNKIWRRRGRSPGIKYLCLWIVNSGWSWSVKQAEAQPPNTSDTHYFLEMSKIILGLESQPLSFSVRDILHRSKSLACVIVAELSLAAVGPSAAELCPLLLTPESTGGSFKFQWQPMILQQFQPWTFCPLTRRFVVTCSSVRSTRVGLQVLGILFTALFHI